MKPERLRTEIDKVRLKAGLLSEKPLTAATCDKCHRRYFWRVVPETCPWPGCDGRIRTDV